MKTKLILLGGGGHCKSCIDVIEQTDQFEIMGILDKPELLGGDVLGYQITGVDDQITELANEGYSFLVTVGQIRSSQLRKKLFKRLLDCDANIAIVTSPLAYVSRHAKVEEGSIIMHHALVNAGAQIGKNCIINSKSLIEHDAIIEDHCHISTAAVINGGAIIREGTFFGSNGVSKEYAKAPVDGFIKAGSLFVGDK